MVYSTPRVTGQLASRLKELDALRETLGLRAGISSPWIGTLRRLVGASSVESSIAIEGYSDGGDESQRAFADYARAMDHVDVMADDPVFEWRDRVILDLHFDACLFQRDRRPGRWRDTPIVVTGPEGGVAYQAPDADRVVTLMGEVVEWLREGDLEAHVVVRAAMAHLHTVSVHPFRDGNGRISRIVQSLVLAREGLLSPEFASIEEYLGSHKREYYAVLRNVQGGAYQPKRDATEWVQFCVEAHIEQARRRLDQLSEAAARWQFLEDLVERRGWPDRLVIALEQSLIGGTDRATYEAEADVSPATASNDFRRLVDAGLIEQTGRGRSIRYHAGAALRNDVAAAIAGRPA
ncbi:MAG: Fic family protein [Actinobacteria bacterium]|nr:Fic family protein [Actinomycetota bacterium]